MPIANCRVLVTGGAGFVGSHLVERLLKEGASVRVLDNLSTGDMRNIDPFLSKIKLIVGDIREKDKVRKAIDGVDIVYHQAAQINPAKAVSDPFFDFEVNAMGTLNLLLEANRQKVKKLIFASTNVYGNAGSETMKEDMPTLAIKDTLLSPYAAAKVSAEAYLKVANDELGLPTVRLRYTNVFGPRQLSKSESGVIAIFVKSALLGKPMVIFGDGTHSRDFVYIDDVVDANILAALNDKINGDVFNVGTGVETSIRGLAVLINKIAKTDVSIQFSQERVADFIRVKADLTHIRETLGFTPKVNIEKGLEKYIEWCRNNLDRL